MVARDKQSATTRENIRQAKEMWDDRQNSVRTYRIENAKKRAKRTPQEQLALIKDRPGKSKKEAARLKEIIKEMQKPAKKPNKNKKKK